MSTSKGDPRRAVYSNRRLKIGVLLLTLLSLPLAALFGFMLWVFVRSSALVDARLAEARNRVPTRVYSRPVSIRASDRLNAEGVVSILNALSYQDARGAEPKPGEFRLSGGSVITLRPRGAPGASGDLPLTKSDETVVIGFDRTKNAGDIVKSIKSARTGADLKILTLEPALISYLFEGEEREKRRFVKYDELPRHLVEALLAIEDRRFFQHPGFDPFSIVGAVLRNLRPSNTLLHGGSTLTQQFVKNFFLNPEDRTLKRKIQEAVL